MTKTCLILCERSSRWAVAFRRALGRDALITQTRSLAACASALAERPAALVGVEVSANNLQTVIDALVAWQRCYPGCRLVALADESLAEADTLLREAGASAVLHSTRQAPRAARLLRRHIAESPAPEMPLEEIIEGRMPWARSATRSA